MPASIGQPPIPAPDGNNTLQVLAAIRNALIAASNTGAGRSSPGGTVNSNTSAPKPSQFVVTNQVIVPVTYTVAGGTGATVTVPQLKGLSLLNSTTNEIWSWSAPGSLTAGGTISGTVGSSSGGGGGVAGATGPTGSAGAAGPTGSAGAAGPTGSAGVSYMITPQQFDALAGSSGHDSTAAIAAAIAACPSGGQVYIPATASGYLISGGFTITQAINIVGDGVGTNFIGVLGSTIDLFHVIVPANSIIRGMSFTKMQISLTGGANWFHIDTQAANSNIAELEISRIQASNPGANAIFIDNIITNSNGGTFDSFFEKNFLGVNNTSGACVNISNGGDSIRVQGGILTGTGYGVLCTLISGAGNLVLRDLNVSATGGLYIGSGVKPIIQNFEIEFGGVMLTGTGIDLGAIDGGTIGPGQIQILSGATGASETIYLSSTSLNVMIDDIRFAAGESGLVGVYAAAGATGMQIGPKNTFSGFSTNTVGCTQQAFH